MNESDANRDMMNAALTRALSRPIDDPLEETQRMPIYDRRRRQAEARTDHLVRVRNPSRDYPDFRDGRREYRLQPHEIAQQDGFPDGDV
jgi:hypothetical protein